MVPHMTVLVTGAASGIGNASARQLLAAGHEVVAVDFDANMVRASLDTSREELEPVSADVSSRGGLPGRGAQGDADDCQIFGGKSDYSTGPCPAWAPGAGG
jgi:NAD(P)-dependent dehydrogenase (short-subunit alcohol dehydrogenase family)